MTQLKQPNNNVASMSSSSSTMNHTNIKNDIDEVDNSDKNSGNATTTTVLETSCLHNNTTNFNIHNNIRFNPNNRNNDNEDDKIFDDQLLSLLTDENDEYSYNQQDYLHPHTNILMNLEHHNQHRRRSNNSVTNLFDNDHRRDNLGQCIDFGNTNRDDNDDDDDVRRSDIKMKGFDANGIAHHNLQHKEYIAHNNLHFNESDYKSKSRSIKKTSITQHNVPATTAIITQQQRYNHGDIRMKRAIIARLYNPRFTLYEALSVGGFIYPIDHCNDLNITDDENITLGQRKNQLSRRLRILREQKVKQRQNQNQNQKATA